MLVLPVALAVVIGSSGYHPSPPEPPPPRWLVANVVRWLPLVERWQDEVEYYDPALVLAVIAQESQGFHTAQSADGHGSVGLMQIHPLPYRGGVRQLRRPEYNVLVGMRILDDAIRQEHGRVRFALARYNCGPRDKVLSDGCGRHGGLNYADRVLNYWYPVFSRYADGADVLTLDETASLRLAGSTRPAQVP